MPRWGHSQRAKTSGVSGFNGQIDHPGRHNEVTRTRVGLFAATHIHLNGTDGSEPEITVVNS